MGDSAHRVNTTALVRGALLLLCFFLTAVACQAKNDCPWMNEATASGVLGGDATGEFADAAAGQPAVCTFTEKDATATRTLVIAIQQASQADTGYKSALDACKAGGMSLQAIGNEAAICAADDRKGALGERVVGRVRDRVFTITLHSSIKGDPLLTRESLKSRVTTAAEQVSGNLF